jgi:signal transduction histidine kinase
MFDAIQKRISATLDGVDEVVRDVRRLIRDVRTEGLHIVVTVGKPKSDAT